MFRFKKILCLFIFICNNFNVLNAQTKYTIQDGYNCMDKQQYSKAITIFDNLLIESPKNKEIKIALARANGLDKNFIRANNIIDSLKQEYPNDIDIKITDAEINLWNNNSLQASKILQPLYNIKTKNKGLLFNYCYALINIKNFSKAFEVLNTIQNQYKNVIDWQDLNKNLRTNYVLDLRAKENYIPAISQLDSILVFNKNDASTLLLKGDLSLQSNQYKLASNTYKNLIPLNYEKSTVLVNTSYALFMQHKTAQALNYAKQALALQPQTTLPIINYFNALLWNLKVKQARAFLKNNENLLKEQDRIMLYARLNTSAGNYKQGLKNYDSAYTKFNDKNYLKEYAEVLLGKKDIAIANNKMESGQNLFTENENNQWKEKWKASKLNTVGSEFVFFEDVIQNKRTEESEFFMQKEGTTYRFGGRVGMLQYVTPVNQKTNAQLAQLNILERWSKAWSGQTDITLQNFKPVSNSNSYMAITGRQLIQYLPNDRRMYSVFYNSEVLNYTVSLLQKNVVNHTLGYITNIMLLDKTGFYSQGSKSFINDGNKKSQFFGSLYYLIRTEPTIKAGLNFLYLHYSDNTIIDYFSPNKFTTTEIFADYASAYNAKYFIKSQAAIGLQQIENKTAEPVYRFQVEPGLRTKRWDASIKYQTSNVASISGLGYKFNWITARVAYKWY